MDTKSLAKSKRAHSLHQSKKNQQHNSSKGASSGPSASTGDKKQSGKQAKEKPAQAHGSRQPPSNWDRYVKEGDDDGFDSGNLVPQDIVAPKSKGADFAHLISEAKGQAPHSSQDVPLFDDVLHDFYQGFGQLLTVKGQSIASWIADDNFGSEDKAPSPDEATFLSLNLHSLAEQLSNATISERLFIEPDSLLPELCMEELQKLSESKHEDVTAKRTSQVVSEDCESMYKFFNSPSNATSTTSSSSCVVSISPGKGSQSIDNVKDETLEIKKLENPKIDPNTAAKKPSSAETELDMLLGSFPVGDVSAVGGNCPLGDMKIDDSVDELLKETSFLINKRKGSVADEAKAAVFRTTPSSSNSFTKSSKLSDDFDSWFDTI
ncbi:unnamed protein product [Cuscuta europaea]|uniref:Uncharacterized protein n=1 Tax=Cuscuta europaea TaxID=41803 RepID=A0A9P1E996_CUSEU|nr:unnamed protein product [Cuscuta europaea]